MNIPLIFWIVPAAAVIALAVAWAFYRSMKREDEGTPRMREIAEHVRKGAMAYLRQQYKVVADRIHHPGAVLRLPGLRRRGAEPLGALRLPDGRFLLGACRLFRHEDRNLCFGAYGQRRTPVARPRPEGRFPQRRRDGARGRGARACWTSRSGMLSSNASWR